MFDTFIWFSPDRKSSTDKQRSMGDSFLLQWRKEFEASSKGIWHAFIVSPSGSLHFSRLVCVFRAQKSDLDVNSNPPKSPKSICTASFFPMFICLIIQQRAKVSIRELIYFVDRFCHAYSFFSSPTKFGSRMFLIWSTGTPLMREATLAQPKFSSDLIAK